MSFTKTSFYIPDKKQEVAVITAFIRITTIGIEAITQTYNDHRLNEKNSLRSCPEMSRCDLNDLQNLMLLYVKNKIMRLG